MTSSIEIRALRARACAVAVAVAGFAAPAAAHPGHPAATHPASPLHWLVEPVHAVVALVVLGALALGLFALRSRAQR